MFPRSDGDAQGQRYFFSRAIPADLEAALAVAFSKIRQRNVTREPYVQAIPTDPDLARELGIAVARFVSTLKAEGQPPQNVLIALKTIIQEHASRAARDIDSFDELQRIVALAAVKSYFGQDDAGRVSVADDARLEVVLEDAPVAEFVTRGQHRVLVVDDDDDTRFILSTYLTAHGYGVVVAQDSREVMNLVRHLKPDVVLLDITMPHLDGLDVLRLLKADADTKRIPVVAVTGTYTLAESPALLSTGFASVIVKPVRQVELLRTVKEAVRAL